MIFNHNLVFTILVIFLVFARVNAQQINTDRPDQTESSVTVPKGSVQIEAGVLFQTEKINTTYQHTNFLPTTLTRIGLTNNFELRIVNQIEQTKVFGISNYNKIELIKL